MFDLVKRNSPTNMLRTLNLTRNEIDKLFEEMFDMSPIFKNTVNIPDFSPSLDVIEKKDKYIINLETPGMEEKDIDISFCEKSNVLSIKGEKTQEEEKSEKNNYYVKERIYGTFKRKISLPENINNDINASYKNGVLKIIINKKEEEKNKTKKIKINTN